MDFEALMSALGGRDDRSVADQGVVDTRVRHQVGLELVEIDVERAIEAKRRRNGADNLGNKAVQVLIAWARNVQIASTNVIDSLVIDQESTIRVLNGAVGRQNGVVRLNDSR